MTAPIVVFRADAGQQRGSGHVRRCLALAASFRAAGWRTAFATEPDSIDTVPELGDGNTTIAFIDGASEPAQQATALADAWPDGVDLLVVDHYGLDAVFERACRPIARRIVGLDDLADRKHDVDVLFDSALGRITANYAALVPTGSRVLTGPAYALLAPAFLAHRAEALARHDGGDGIREVLRVGLGPPLQTARVQVVDETGVPQGPLPIEDEHLRGGRRIEVGCHDLVWIEEDRERDLRLRNPPIHFGGILRIADQADEDHCLVAMAISQLVQHRHGSIGDRAVEVEEDDHGRPGILRLAQRPRATRRTVEFDRRHHLPDPTGWSIDGRIALRRPIPSRCRPMDDLGGQGRQACNEHKACEEPRRARSSAPKRQAATPPVKESDPPATQHSVPTSRCRGDRRSGSRSRAARRLP